MPDSDKLAIAAHLHVLLRRKTGRVTDTEWMAANADYAQEIVRFARLRAVEDNAPELAEWADRLDHALQATPPAAPRRKPDRRQCQLCSACCIGCDVHLPAHGRTTARLTDH